jgi:hypothetical protein
MGKLLNLLNLFRKGDAVANPEAWKDGGNAVMLLVPLFMAIVKIAGDFGYGLQLTTEEATSIAGGVVAAVQFVVHNISSDKAGILPAKSSPDP